MTPHDRVVAEGTELMLPMKPPEPIRRLHWGCGRHIAPGWINCDIIKHPGVDISCNILDGLPLADNSVDYISAQHVLPEITIAEQLVALRELRRVLKSGGVLRLSLPDFDKAIAAYETGCQHYFQVWDWNTISGNFITQLVWYNVIHTPFTYEFAEELLQKAGFTDIRQAGYRETSSAFSEIVELDNRPEESFYIEGFK